MAENRSRIWTEVDFAAEGKQVSNLHLPHSVNRSAYGTIAIPVAVVHNGSGPTVFLSAGCHGDEYEGQLALCRLIRELEPEDVQGRIIIVPALNLPAALAGARVSPIDDLNLNRCFPGDPDGRPTEQIAYYVDSVLLPLADAWFDLHSGGSSLDYLPFASIHEFRDEALNARALATLEAFGSPISMVWSFTDETRMGSGSAERNGVIFLGSELGGKGSVNPDGVAIAYHGTLRALKHLGVLREGAKFETPPPAPPRFMDLADRSYYVYAPTPGLFEPLCRLGDTVAKGLLFGRVHFVDDPAREPVPVYFRRDGMLICMRHPGRVERGDCVAHLATDREV